MARNPITWRNVGATVSPGAGAQGMRSAQEGIMAGMGALERALSQHQEDRQDSWDTLRDNNTQDFLDQLAQYRSAEDFQAAQESGTLQQLYQGYGNAIDRETARTALDSRLGTLQQRDTATQQHQDLQQKVANRDKRAVYMDLQYQGRHEEADRLWREHLDSWVDAAGLRGDGWDAETSYRGEQRNQAGEARSAARFNRDQTVWGREDEAFERQEAERVAQQEQDRAIRDAVLGAREDRSHVLNTRQQIMHDLGITNLEEASEDQLLAYREAAQAEGVYEDPTTLTAQATDVALDYLAGDDRRTIQDALRIKREIDGNWQGMQELSTEDRRDLDARIESVEESHRSQLEEAQRNFDRLKRDNVFLADLENPAYDMESLIGDVDKDNIRGLTRFNLSAVQKDNLINSLVEITTRGVPVGSTGQRARIHPAMVKAYIEKNQDNFTGDIGRAVMDDLKELVSMNMEDFRKAESALDEFVEENNGINRSALKGVSAVEGQFLRDSGILTNPNGGADMVDRLIQKRLKDEQDNVASSVMDF